MRLIGEVVALQVQTRSLKVGERPSRRYDPAPITAVARLTLDEGGVVGWDRRGGRLEDVHHRDHPQSKNRGHNGVSIGLTAHYAAMRDRFGAHLADGVSGENILVRGDGPLLGLAGDLLVEGPDGRRLVLGGLRAAAPCVEFSCFSLGRPGGEHGAEEIKAALQFLDRGMRGYYATPAGAGSVEVGDLVYRL